VDDVVERFEAFVGDQDDADVGSMVQNG